MTLRARSIDLAPEASRLASLLLSYIPAYAPSSRLAIRAPRPRSSTDLAIRGPLARRIVSLQLRCAILHRDETGSGRRFLFKFANSRRRPATHSNKVSFMFSRSLCTWLFCAFTLPASPVFAGPASFLTPYDSLQDRPNPPQFAVDACRNLSEGDACTVEFQGQKLAGACKRIGSAAALACLPSGSPRPPS